MGLIFRYNSEVVLMKQFCFPQSGELFFILCQVVEFRHAFVHCALNRLPGQVNNVRNTKGLEDFVSVKRNGRNFTTWYG